MLDNSGIGGQYFGVYQGVVSDNNDSLNQGRVRAHVPMVHADQLSPWIIPMLTTQRKPKVGATIYVQYLNGDAAKPLYLPVPEIKTEDIANKAITTALIDDAAVTPAKLSEHNSYYP